jgi:hypothetical protein
VWLPGAARWPVAGPGLLQPTPGRQRLLLCWGGTTAPRQRWPPGPSRCPHPHHGRRCCCLWRGLLASHLGVGLLGQVALGSGCRLCLLLLVMLVMLRGLCWHGGASCLGVLSWCLRCGRWGGLQWGGMRGSNRGWQVAWGGWRRWCVYMPP